MIVIVIIQQNGALREPTPMLNKARPAGAHNLPEDPQVVLVSPPSAHLPCKPLLTCPLKSCEAAALEVWWVGPSRNRQLILEPKGLIVDY